MRRSKAWRECDDEVERRWPESHRPSLSGSKTSRCRQEAFQNFGYTRRRLSQSQYQPALDAIDVVLEPTINSVRFYAFIEDPDPRSRMRQPRSLGPSLDLRTLPSRTDANLFGVCKCTQSREIVCRCLESAFSDVSQTRRNESSGEDVRRRQGFGGQGLGAVLT